MGCAKGTKHSGEPMDKQEIEEMEKAEKAEASSGVAINSKKGSVHARTRLCFQPVIRLSVTGVINFIWTRPQAL